jgi:hypothetical protein
MYVGAGMMRNKNSSGEIENPSIRSSIFARRYAQLHPVAAGERGRILAEGIVE